MPEPFVPLSLFLRPETAPQPAMAGDDAVSSPPGDGDAARPELPAAVGDVRRFRAAVADAVDASLEALLTDIASDVVARELHLKPVDVAAIVARAKGRLNGEHPVCVRVHPADADAAGALDVDVVADPALRRGDVVFETRSGTIDLTLGARLERVLKDVRV